MPAQVDLTCVSGVLNVMGMFVLVRRCRWLDCGVLMCALTPTVLTMVTLLLVVILVLLLVR